jgi:hypothetical protein
LTRVLLVLQAIMAEGKELAMAIGILTLSTDDMYAVGEQVSSMTDADHSPLPCCACLSLSLSLWCSRKQNKGVAIEMMHFLGDDLWLCPHID